MVIDKFYHFLAGAFIAILMATAGIVSSAILVTIAVIAVLKEIYDLEVEKTFIDVLDIIATIFGGLTVLWILEVGKAVL
jgi:hypothetical protein